jgi:hypothetical protein
MRPLVGLSRSEWTVEQICALLDALKMRINVSVGRSSPEAIEVFTSVWSEWEQLKEENSEVAHACDPHYVLFTSNPGMHRYLIVCIHF